MWTVFDSDELGQFLRSRREAVTPAEVGLPTGRRRRTPGLRRAELATLAGVSVDYLIRLEQGRDRHPSGQVLGALADAMRLTDDERAHLGKLAAVTQNVELCPSAMPPARTVRPTVQALLDRLEPAPAFVLNGLSDVLAWTAGYERVAAPLGILDDRPPNLLRFTFEDARARTVYPNWGAIADEQVANLRASLRPDDGEAKALVDSLAASAGAEFRARWEARPVTSKRTGVKRIVHPEVGELRLAFETMHLPDVDGQRLVVYFAADEATSGALDLLNGRRPGGLRAVGG
jgi:transcriptional regulator with XRE-family HTH domain